MIFSTTYPFVLQINSVLDIEFILPQFIRKKFCVSEESFEHDRDASKSVFSFFYSRYHVPKELKNFTRSFSDDDDEDEVFSYEVSKIAFKIL